MNRKVLATITLIACIILLLVAFFEFRNLMVNSSSDTTGNLVYFGHYLYWVLALFVLPALCLFMAFIHITFNKSVRGIIVLLAAGIIGLLGVEITGLFVQSAGLRNLVNTIVCIISGVFFIYYYQPRKLAKKAR